MALLSRIARINIRLAQQISDEGRQFSGVGIVELGKAFIVGKKAQIDRAADVGVEHRIL